MYIGTTSTIMPESGSGNQRKPSRIYFDNNIYLFSADESLSNKHTALG